MGRGSVEIERLCPTPPRMTVQSYAPTPLGNEPLYAFAQRPRVFRRVLLYVEWRRLFVKFSTLSFAAGGKRTPAASTGVEDATPTLLNSQGEGRH